MFLVLAFHTYWDTTWYVRRLNLILDDSIVTFLFMLGSNKNVFEYIADL